MKPTKKTRSPWTVEIPQECRDSQSRANLKLIAQAHGWKLSKKSQTDTVQFGENHLDLERFILADVEKTGTLFATPAEPAVRYLEGLLEKRRVVTGAELNRVEYRINRLVIRLGKALEPTRENRQKRKPPGPDWNAVGQVERYVVAGWCQSIIIDGKQWPPLCCLTVGALKTFLGLSNEPHCKQAAKDATKYTAADNERRGLEARLRRLGLVRLPKGRFKVIRRPSGQFIFE